MTGEKYGFKNVGVYRQAAVAGGTDGARQRDPVPAHVALLALGVLQLRVPAAVPAADAVAAGARREALEGRDGGAVPLRAALGHGHGAERRRVAGRAVGVLAVRAAVEEGERPPRAALRAADERGLCDDPARAGQPPAHRARHRRRTPERAAPGRVRVAVLRRDELSLRLWVLEPAVRGVLPADGCSWAFSCWCSPRGCGLRTGGGQSRCWRVFRPRPRC